MEGYRLIRLLVAAARCTAPSQRYPCNHPGHHHTGGSPPTVGSTTCTGRSFCFSSKDHDKRVQVHVPQFKNQGKDFIFNCVNDMRFLKSCKDGGIVHKLP